jgi:leucyl aminopeptidase
MKFDFKALGEFSAEVAVFLVTDSKELSPSIANLDKSGQLARAIEVDVDFATKPNQMITITAPHGFSQKHIILLSLGKVSDLKENGLQGAGGLLAVKLNQLKISEADLVIDISEETEIDIATNLMLGIKLKNYIFDRHFVAKKDDNKIYLSQVNILSSISKHDRSNWIAQECIADGVMLTRDLVTESPNNLYPEAFAEECEKLSEFGLNIKILKQKELESLKMGALLGVAQGSINEPRVVVMEWLGDKSSNDKLALVGKGVTFDSGGINLKPSAGIADMKYDMGGAGVVTGVMMSLAKRKSKANVIGLIGLVENMPSGSAQRPSDVVVSMSGQTIEIDNTDAEGRLVLADVMWYAQENYKPNIMIDLATLTGAITVALGDYCAGLFVNDDELASSISKAADAVNEQVWRLPMNDFYDKQINSEIADIKNTGQSGRGGGSITAAQFLKRFVKDCRWAHLDIAGVTWTKLGTDLCPKGATGFGVRLLNRFIIDNLEKDR